MRKVETIKINKEVEELTEVTCDWCKKKYKKTRNMFHPPVGKISARFGYGSKFDNINGDYEADICDDCFEQHMRPIMKDYGEWVEYKEGLDDIPKSI